MSQNRKWRAVNMAFMKKDKEAIKDVEGALEHFHQCALDFAFAGYKVGFSFDGAADAYILAITGKTGTRDDENKSFMAFHKDREVLAQILVYVHQKAAQGESLSYLFDKYHDMEW